MSRWQHWLRGRGGNREVALAELAACTMTALLILLGIVWYVVELVNAKGEINDAIFNYIFGGDEEKKRGKVPFMTVVYFLYVMLVLTLFLWGRIQRMKKGAFRAVVASFCLFIVFGGVYLIMGSSVQGFHIRKASDVGFVISIWYFYRSHLMHLYFSGYILRKRVSIERMEQETLYRQQLDHKDPLAWMHAIWESDVYFAGALFLFSISWIVGAIFI